MPEFAQIQWRERNVALEYVWVRPSNVDAQRNAALPIAQGPLCVLLHEGLGSVAMWRDFPQQLADRLGCELLVYSRPGYGWSTERPQNEVWANDFLHQQAHEVLPAFLQALGLQFTDDGQCTTRPLHLLGHSDGASIALLYAARYKPDSIIVMAPHIMVEDISVTSIQQAKRSYENSDLPIKLARYHQSVDSAFWGWNQVWLSPEFLDWNIGAEIKSITCPILAIQGEGDEYGSMLQIEGIARQCPQTQLVKLGDCKHSPHRDQPEQVMQQVKQFLT
jgi:pimeloyl-ACP methyl ester carboxylesterase